MTSQNEDSSFMTSIVDENEELISIARDRLIEASMAENIKDWRYYNTIKDKIRVYTKRANNGCVCVCGTGMICATKENMLKEIRNKKNWKKLDQMMENGEYFDLTETQRILHLSFSGITAILAKRDMVFLETIYEEDSKTTLLISTKTPLEKELYPTNNDYVRVEMMSGGWMLKQISDTICCVTYYINVDFKLNYINSTIMNMLVSKIPHVILKLEEIIVSKK